MKRSPAFRATGPRHRPGALPTTVRLSPGLRLRLGQRLPTAARMPRRNARPLRENPAIRRSAASALLSRLRYGQRKALPLKPNRRTIARPRHPHRRLPLLICPSPLRSMTRSREETISRAPSRLSVHRPRRPNRVWRARGFSPVLRLSLFPSTEWPRLQRCRSARCARELRQRQRPAAGAARICRSCRSPATHARTYHPSMAVPGRCPVHSSPWLRMASCRYRGQPHRLP